MCRRGSCRGRGPAPVRVRGAGAGTWTMHSAAGASERLYEPVRPLQTRLPRIRTCCHAQNVAILLRALSIHDFVSEDPSSVRAVLRAPRASVRWRCPARRSPRACDRAAASPCTRGQRGRCAAKLRGHLLWGKVFTRQMRGQASRTRGHRAALQSALRPARCTARTRARRATRSSCGASRGHRTGDGAGGPPACTALRRFVQRSVQRSLVQRSVRRLHNHPCPTEHAHRVVHVRTAAGTRAAAEGGANGQCMPLPLLAHAQAEGSPAVAHNASFWRSTRLRLSSLAAGV